MTFQVGVFSECFNFAKKILNVGPLIGVVSIQQYLLIIGILKDSVLIYQTKEL